MTHAYYAGRLDERRIGELAPTVFATAAAGDPVARAIIDRLADELVDDGGRRSPAGRILVRRDPEVVLAGGVFRTDDAGVPRSAPRRLTAGIPGRPDRPARAPPVVGAALIGLDRLRRAARSIRRSRPGPGAGLDAWNATPVVVTPS